MSIRGSNIEKLRSVATRKYKWEPFRYTADNDAEMLAFWNLFHQDVNRHEQRFFDWQYKDNPAGPALIWLAQKNTELIGQYVILPARYIINGQVMLGSLSLNTLTHEAHRGKGIFILLADLAYRECEEKGISFTYGSPNDNSYGGFVNKLGFSDIGNLALLVKVERMANILVHMAQNKILKQMISFFACLINAAAKLFFLPLPGKGRRNVAIQKIDKIDERFDVLWRQAAGQYKNIGIRDSRYLQWRYMDCPENKYEIYAAIKDGQIEGYIVLSTFKRPRGNEGIILDIIAINEGKDNAISKLLIKKALKVFNSKKIDIVNCMLVPGSEIEKSFAWCGFRKCPNIFKTSPFRIIIKSHNKGSSSSEINNLSDWHFTFGDFDIY